MLTDISTTGTFKAMFMDKPATGNKVIHELYSIDKINDVKIDC